MIDGGIVHLPVKDVGASVRFYVETLGMKLVALELEEKRAVIDCGEGFLIELTEGRAAIGLYSKMPLAESRAILENRGVAFDEADRFVDPDGNVFHLSTRS